MLWALPKGAPFFYTEAMGSTGSDEVFDPEPFRRGLESRNAQRQVRIEERAARARAFLPRIRDAFLEIDPDMRRLVLFGSLAKGLPNHEDFDIDVAVSSSRYLRLVAWALDQEWKVDVIDLDGIAGTFLEDIEDQAEVLYEKRR